MATGAPTRPPVFNLPNQLTASRFVLGLVLFVLIEVAKTTNEAALWLACIAVFAVAAVTDWLDGYFARKQGLTSSLGRNLDPLVDKVVICGAYTFLLPVPNSGLYAWMVTVVLSRELIITGLRSFMESRGGAFGADWMGKVKMVLQCVVLFGIFGFLFLLYNSGWPRDTLDVLSVLRDVLIYLMLAATALSGLQYLWHAAVLLKDD